MKTTQSSRKYSALQDQRLWRIPSVKTPRKPSLGLRPPITCQITGWRRFSLFLRRMACLPLILLNSNCSTLVTSIDHKKEDWENADLWRRVNDEPAVFHPRTLLHGAPVTPATGDWVVDPQDHAAFFVPNEKCGDLTPGMWRAEALKGVNKFSRSTQTARNSAMVLLGWPAYTALLALSGLGR